jgi:predicted ribosome quality control (RQC) complex YloA/Tae2 family protein
VKLYQLKAIAQKLASYKHIKEARRVEDNTIEIIFDKDNSYFFDMTRGHSFIYKRASKRPIQSYQAPFDNILHSLVAYSTIVSIDVPNDDRVIRFTLAPKSSYKEKLIYLQFEFTGKNTNAILIDSDEVIIEALRHIDSSRSFRVVRPSVELLPLPPYNSKYSEDNIKIEDADKFMEKNWQEYEDSRLKSIKKQKLSTLEKKINKLSKLLNNLANENSLKEETTKYQNYGNLVLANLYNIKPYDRKLKTYDFDGNEITINLPKDIKVNRISQHFFNISKRAKNRAKNIHIEKNNLQSKVDFYQNIYHSAQSALDVYELELLIPKRAKSKKKKEKLKECELFWIDDYKVLVGRNSQENQKLLQLAKANDIWMHIRDIPSSHILIKTDKQNLPKSVIESASKLCVDFSVKRAGEYEVDYTKRKFVKVQNGSNVLYNKYETIRVRKEGVEIRE